MNDGTWQAPPVAGLNWYAELEALKARPGDWRIVKVCPTRGAAGTTAYRLRKGILNVPDGVYEFRSNGKNVHARYLGGAGKNKGQPGMAALGTRSIATVTRWAA